MFYLHLKERCLNPTRRLKFQETTVFTSYSKLFWYMYYDFVKKISVETTPMDSVYDAAQSCGIKSDVISKFKGETNVCFYYYLFRLFLNNLF